MTNEQTIPTFFYGSYINRQVLAEVDLDPERFEVARLSGYDLRIAPLANLVVAEARSVYGVLATATQAELDRLYTHAREVLGGTYLPESVLVQLLSGEFEPAQCYIAPNLPEAAPDEAYVQRILGPARALGFPEWYLSRIEAFLPASDGD